MNSSRRPAEFQMRELSAPSSGNVNGCKSRTVCVWVCASIYAYHVIVWWCWRQRRQRHRHRLTPRMSFNLCFLRCVDCTLRHRRLVNASWLNRELFILFCYYGVARMRCYETHSSDAWSRSSSHWVANFFYQSFLQFHMWIDSNKLNKNSRWSKRHCCEFKRKNANEIKMTVMWPKTRTSISENQEKNIQFCQRKLIKWIVNSCDCGKFEYHPTSTILNRITDDILSVQWARK